MGFPIEDNSFFLVKPAFDTGNLGFPGQDRAGQGHVE